MGSPAPLGGLCTTGAGESSCPLSLLSLVLGSPTLLTTAGPPQVMRLTHSSGPLSLHSTKPTQGAAKGGNEVSRGESPQPPLSTLREVRKKGRDETPKVASHHDAGASHLGPLHQPSLQGAGAWGLLTPLQVLLLRVSQDPTGHRTRSRCPLTPSKVTAVPPPDCTLCPKDRKGEHKHLQEVLGDGGER